MEHSWWAVLNCDNGEYFGPLAYAVGRRHDYYIDYWMKKWDGKQNWLECLLLNTAPVDTQRLLMLLGIHPVCKYTDFGQQVEYYTACFDLVHTTKDGVISDVTHCVPITSEDWLALVKAKSKDNPLWYSPDY